MEIKVYKYHYIDLRPDIKDNTFELYKAFYWEDFSYYGDEFMEEQYDHTRSQVSKAFVKAGWEGDGKIQLIWIPPFINTGFEGDMGSLIWHVKQSNNGTSFLAFIDCEPSDSFINLTK